MVVKDTPIREGMMIGEGCRVSMHFALKLANGDIVDSNFDRRAADFTIGDGNLPRGFEKYLLGLHKGDHKSFKVPPEDAFGQSNPSNIQTVPRSRFAPDMELSEGLVVSFADSAGEEVPGVISEYDEQSVTVDFNHPLAGKILTFDVDILSVDPSRD